MKLRTNDKVAILSPSSTLAGTFPWVFEQGLERLKSIFNLEPFIMPNCLNIHATQQDRADDLHSAFRDSSIKAVISCIGGIDQIRLISFLNPDIFKSNPKLFFGYSDNTHLCNFLYSNGVQSGYGGSVMTQLAMQKEMDAATVANMKWSFFEQGLYEIIAPPYSVDEDLPWDDKNQLSKKRPSELGEPFIFDGNDDAEGTLWGGCLESLCDLMRVGKRTPHHDDFSRFILFLETSEEIPTHEFVRRFMISLGEAGYLKRIRGLILGRPKTWFFDHKMQSQQKSEYRKLQAKTVLEIFRQYNSTAPMVSNVNIGHTDPQAIVPYGGKAQIKTQDKRLLFIF